MSLINEALKRAKQVQAPPPASPGPQLRPVDPGQYAKRSPGLMSRATFGIVAVVAIVLLWQWLPKSGPAASSEPQTQAVIAATATPLAEPAPIVREPAPVVAQEVEPARAGTNSPAIAEAAPKPAPLRLQAIFWSPTRPSAMIGGKTRFVGDKLGEYRVVAIDQESATLAGAGQTNVLSLAQ